ncbi:ankyrin repeat-containing domain protein [Mycena latifolia]|nr:ankyrin repeat-containing domain protein [Mycena latifolia]
MAEALGTLASVLQLVDTVLKAREYFKDFHEAPKEQKKLFSEMEGLKALLVELDKQVEGNSSSAAFQEMVKPLAALKTTMEHVTEKLGPVDGQLKFTKRLSWTLWSKKEVAGYLEEFERIKALINLWLTMEIWDVGQKQISNQDSIWNTVQEQKDTIDAEKRQKILDWMSPLNFLQRQADIFNALQSGTGEWLLGKAGFQEWESGSGKVLFCHGIPGAGKTVLVSLVVHHLETCARTTDIGLACIYLNHKETETQTITNLLGGLWRQLMLGKTISSTVQNLYDYHQERQTRPQLEEVCKALDSAVALYLKVYFIIDALDEYPEKYRHRFLKYLGTLGPKVNIMMTSRPHINLDAQFPNMKTIEIHATEEDIHKYLDTQIQNSVRLSKYVQTRPELQDEIQSKILGNVKGMFLLAKLHIESLATKNTIKAVREALQHLPRDLQHTYDEAMERINYQTKEDRELGLLALTWVANAKRPLSAAELREALAIEPESLFLDTDNLLGMDIILSACAGLMIVDDTVSVGGENGTALQAASGNGHESVVKLLIEKGADVNAQGGFFGNALQAASANQVQLLIKKGADVNAQGGHFGNALQAALWNGHESVVQLLIEKGADVNAQGGYYGNALQAASVFGHESVVQLLIKKGADGASLNGHNSVVQLLIGKGAKVNARGGPYGNALQAASWNGHESVVQLLIEKGADVNAQGGFFGNALQAASLNGYKSVVQLLIKKDVEVNARGGPYGNALQAASWNGHKSVVQLLIEKGADVNAQGGPYGNALQTASRHDHESVVELLIEKGADVNAQGGQYGNALQAASRNGLESVVQLLIEKGADVNARGGDCGNALQAASENGNKLVVQLLIEKGADVNAQGGDCGNALQAASVYGHESVVQLLIEKGADVNAQGGYYGNSLQAASRNGHELVVQLLINHGAEASVLQ